MKEKILYCVWAAMYIVCVGFGSAENRSPFLILLLGILALAFFVPGIMLIHQGVTTGNKKILRRVRIISIASLSLTLCMIIVNIICTLADEEVGHALHDLLNLVSAPMFCCLWRWTSLFLWACLLIGSFPRLWEK